jgi:hypothetical protein
MHDITIELRSTIDKETVESIIKQFVEERTGKSINTIQATVKDNNFIGFSITYDSEIPEVPVLNTNGMHKKPVVIDKTFKLMVFD